MPAPRGEAVYHFGDSARNVTSIPNRSIRPASSDGALKILQQHVLKLYEDETLCQEPWQKLPEIPTSAEIMSYQKTTDQHVNIKKIGLEQKDFYASPDLPTNVVDHAWESKKKYIAAHYQLIREDGIAPLRRAVETFREQPGMMDSGDICIYTQVFIVGYTMANQGVAPRIEFSHERSGKRIRWNQSKRLQQGTIVALSPRRDMFQSICKIAVVAARPVQGVEQNPPQIDLYWGDNNEAEFDPVEEYMMIESRAGYFEAYRHMLVAMQKLVTERFPLSAHLAALDQNIGAPQYLEQQPFTNLNSLAPQPGATEEESTANIPKQAHLNETFSNVDVRKDWPTIPGTSLDDSQLKAVKRILAKKLAIVQGPPGTGKTFVSISALKVMLDNWSPGDPPIIVAAQTNHALDQLLTILATSDEDFQAAFVRLGGRASEDNKLVLQRTLYAVKSKDRARNGGRDVGGGGYKNCRAALNAAAESLLEKIQRALCQSSDESQMFLEHEVITQEQFDSLNDDDWVCARDDSIPPGVMASWLGPEQIRDPPRCHPVNLGFEEEEIDPNFEELEELEAETRKKDDDDIDALHGVYHPFRELFTGRRNLDVSEKRARKELKKKGNLWSIDPSKRGEIYRFLRRELKKKLLGQFREGLNLYKRRADNLKVARWESDSDLVRRISIKLIGCTTTGLSKYRGLLASLHPRTLLIEEAAETLEGTVLAAQFESLQQLILVGDHQQLQASCNVNELAKAPFNLAISMFERLVNNGIEFTMLKKQRRMITGIRKLLDPFYTDLQDHHSVLDRKVNRQPVPGMGGRDVYWYHHSWPEGKDETASRYNLLEAEMIANFFAYLFLNGLDHSQITVLTFYNGQRKVILKELRKNQHLHSHVGSFNVFTVDSYQGEENDIILLSLVRSNNNAEIGFLENKNRAVVALSRARRGMYVFGNLLTLLGKIRENDRLWYDITKKFIVSNPRGLDRDRGLPIVCSTHNTEMSMIHPDNFDGLAGGCTFDCGGELPCGHPCPHKCHPFSHEKVICKQPCGKTLPGCEHKCSELCGSRCRCPCDRHLELAAEDEGNYGFCPPTLNDILGDSPGKQAGLRQRHTSRATPARFSQNSGSSTLPTTNIWANWDPRKADQEIEEEKARSSKSTSPVKSSGPVFKEVHLPVNLKNGSRVNMRIAATTRIVPPVSNSQMVNRTITISNFTDPSDTAPDRAVARVRLARPPHPPGMVRRPTIESISFNRQASDENDVAARLNALEQQLMAPPSLPGREISAPTSDIPLQSTSEDLISFD